MPLSLPVRKKTRLILIHSASDPLLNFSFPFSSSSSSSAPFSLTTFFFFPFQSVLLQAQKPSAGSSGAPDPFHCTMKTVRAGASKGGEREVFTITFVFCPPLPFPGWPFVHFSFPSPRSRGSLAACACARPGLLSRGEGVACFSGRWGAHSKGAVESAARRRKNVFSLFLSLTAAEFWLTTFSLSLLSV